MSRRLMKFAPFVQLAATAAAALALCCSCEEMDTYQQTAASAIHAVLPGQTPPPGWWNDQGGSGEARIVVHLGEQKAYFYKGKTLIGETTVSTGKPGFSTPPGHYQVVSKDRDHVSS